MNCFLISGQFSQIQCSTFESGKFGRTTTTTYDYKRVRGNSCEITVSTLLEFNGEDDAGLTQNRFSESCSYVPECYTQGGGIINK